MKLLTIGIDGGDREIFDKFEMPFIKKLQQQGEIVEVTEDLWSRGWASIVTGVRGSEHGGFYEKPVLDGTYGFTQKFGIKDIDANADIIPLWEMLNKSGHNIGMMNVPGTAPAPEVSGFFVSGAGGGLGKVENIPEELCFPKSIKDELKNLGYVSDIRFSSSGIKDIEMLFSRLIVMQERRAEAFITLTQKYNVDFGFVAFMATSRVQNIAMSEICAYKDSVLDPTSSFQQFLQRLYRSLDDCIAHIVSEINPDRLMIVADHGAAPYEYSMNLNNFLENLGFLKKRNRNSLVSIVKKVAPARLKASIVTSIPKTVSQFSGESDFKNTYAFGHRYVPGIYINDKKRFNGPVKTENEVQKLVYKICDAFNENSYAKKFGMNAKPYRSENVQAKFYNLLPDIWIDKPDNIFVEGRGAFIEKNMNYKKITDINNVTGDIYSGIKGRFPLFLVDRKIGADIVSNDKKDLTLAYKLIRRSFNL